MKDDLVWLQEWYAEQCDGDWEHVYGIRIGTLDNPGWRVEIDLAETDLSDLVVERVLIERSEHDWISYQVSEQKFLGHGGPLCLGEILGVFRRHFAAATQD